MTHFPQYLRQIAAHGLALACLLSASVAWAEVTLQGRYRQLQGDGHAVAGIHIVSSEAEGRLGAEVIGLLHHPYPEVTSLLVRPDNWCRFMPLHFNIKACTHGATDGEAGITLYSGRKHYQPPEQGYTLSYHFTTLRHDPNGLQLLLSATEGPASTRDYRILVQAEPLGEETLLRIDSSYAPSLLGNLLTRGYLNTLGRDKIGFSRDERDEPVQGVRGVVERNVVRYQLAIEAVLASRALPEALRHEAALVDWFARNERYPQQLHEMELEEYLVAKRREWREQQRLQRALEARLEVAASR